MTPEERIAREQKLAAYDGPDRIVASTEFWEMIKDRPPLLKHGTGIKSLDEATDGFIPGELVVISGPTGMGKTLLCDSVINHLRNQSKFSLFFTFEVTPEKIVENHRTPESVVFLPLQHRPMDLPWLRDRCEEAKLKYGCDAVFVDHLHYVVDMASRNNMSLEIGTTMRYMKMLALDLKLAVFIVCHTGKVPIDQEPSINHLRDSSFVAQEADLVLMVFRRFDKDPLGTPQPTLLQGLATIKIEKARRSGAMGTRIKVRKRGNILVESFDEPEEVQRNEHRTYRRAGNALRSGKDKASMGNEVDE